MERSAAPSRRRKQPQAPHPAHFFLRAVISTRAKRSGETRSPRPASTASRSSPIETVVISTEAKRSGETCSPKRRFPPQKPTFYTGASQHRATTPTLRMQIDIVTLFPGFFTGPFSYGILHRALRDGKLSVGTHDLRDF